MPKRLVNPTVKYISILTDETKPANGKGVIIKGEKMQEIFRAEVLKQDIEGDIYWRAMVSGEIDTDNETYTKEDVKNAQRKFMKSLQTTKALSDTNHDMNPLDNVFMVESYITELDNGELAWDGVTNVKENKDLFAKAKEGKITGVSIYGWVESKEEVGKLEKMVNAIYEKLFGKEQTINKEEVEMTTEQIKAMSDEELKELGLARLPTETPQETPKSEAPAEEPEELKMAKSDLDEKTLLLSKAQEQIDTLKAEIDALKKDNDILEKRNLTKPNTNAELSKEAEEKLLLTKADYNKLDTSDKMNYDLKFKNKFKE